MTGKHSAAETAGSEDEGAARIFHGWVREKESSFKDGKFQPMNGFFGSFHPAAEPARGPYAAQLKLLPGEYFEVPRIGRFLHYPHAYSAARHQGEYDSDGPILICTPVSTDITVTNEAGETVILDTVREYRAAQSIPYRLEFPNR